MKITEGCVEKGETGLRITRIPTFSHPKSSTPQQAPAPSRMRNGRNQDLRSNFYHWTVGSVILVLVMKLPRFHHMYVLCNGKSPNHVGLVVSCRAYVFFLTRTVLDGHAGSVRYLGSSYQFSVMIFFLEDTGVTSPSLSLTFPGFPIKGRLGSHIPVDLARPFLASTPPICSLSLSHSYLSS